MKPKKELPPIEVEYVDRLFKEFKMKYGESLMDDKTIGKTISAVCHVFFWAGYRAEKMRAGHAFGVYIEMLFDKFVKK